MKQNSRTSGPTQSGSPSNEPASARGPPLRSLHNTPESSSDASQLQDSPLRAQRDMSSRAEESPAVDGSFQEGAEAPDHSSWPKEDSSSSQIGNLRQQDRSQRQIPQHTSRACSKGYPVRPRPNSAARASLIPGQPAWLDLVVHIIQHCMSLVAYCLALKLCVVAEESHLGHQKRECSCYDLLISVNTVRVPKWTARWIGVSLACQNCRGCADANFECEGNGLA